MADERSGRLTELDILRLSAAISARAMESTAISYLGLEIERVMSLKDVYKDNVINFNRDVIKNWSDRNLGSDQKQVSFN